MTPLQILFLLAASLIAVGVLRKTYLRRTVPHYDATSVREKLKEKAGITLLDVRTSAERSRGHIRGSIHIPLQELHRRAADLEKFRQTEIICYCQSGSRSLSAAHTLRRMGYRAANLAGGASAWRLGE